MGYWKWFFKCLLLPGLLLTVAERMSTNTIDNSWIKIGLKLMSGLVMMIALEIYLYASLKTKLRWYDE